jgi:membrane protease YdiL (CAAX protease family)
MAMAVPVDRPGNHKYLYSGLVLLGVLALSAVLAWVNYAYYNWLSPQFEGSSSHTVWGIIQRLYLIIPIIIISLWKPRQIGYQVGKTFQHTRMLLVMLALNVAVIWGYKLLAGDTPYTGTELLFNEVITVPLVEEIFWRGIIFAALFAVLKRFLSEESSGMLAGVYSGICFGLLHSTNALFGYPLAFVALQVLNATIWGVTYGIARAKTDSVYPPILLHAAMNLVAVL